MTNEKQQNKPEEPKRISNAIKRKIESSIFNAIRAEPFYASISRLLKKIPSYDIPTAGVTILEGRYTLIYNPDFMMSLDQRGRAGVIMHEIQHLIYEHINPDGNSFIPPKVSAALRRSRQDGKPVSTKEEFVKKGLQDQRDLYHLKLWNIAADLAINSSLRDWLPYEPHTSLKDLVGRLDQRDVQTMEKFFKQDIFTLSQEHQDELEFLLNQNLQSISEDEVEWIFSLSDNKTLDNLTDDDMRLMKNFFIGPAFKGCFPLQKRTKWEDIDFHKAATQYYDHIIEKFEQDKQDGGQSLSDALADAWDQMQNASWDDHSQWGDGSEQNQEQAEQDFRSVVGEAANEANNTQNGWGSVSHEFRQIVESFLTPKIKWSAFLKRFILKSQRANRKSSWRAVNRRMPGLRPGRVKSNVANIAICIDMSGSVSNEEMAIFFSELRSLSDLATFTVVPFDHAVLEKEVYVWQKGDKNKKVERQLCGGTNFQAPSDFVDQSRRFDGMVILTDLEAPRPNVSKTQRMWISTRAQDFCGTKPYPHETLIKVDLKDYR